MKRLLAFALLFAVSLSQVSAFEADSPPAERAAEPLVPVVTEVRTGNCTRVVDGDTIEVRAYKGVFTVRLEGIDAPERYQDHSAKATKALADLVLRRDVEVHLTGTDQYGRHLAIVKVGEVNVNERLLADGWVWQYDEFNTDPAWATLEEEARAEKRGLWAHENQIPPWEFRKLEGQRRQAARTQRQGLTAETAPAAPDAETAPMTSADDDASLGYWLNSSSNVRHNSSCRYYKNTKRGRPCSKTDGKACGICGG